MTTFEERYGDGDAPPSSTMSTSAERLAALMAADDQEAEELAEYLANVAELERWSQFER